jgi:hypothetical protein
MNDEELATHLPKKPTTDGPHPAVLVGPGVVDEVLERLLLHFDADPDDELEVQRDGVTLGYLSADTLYALLPRLTRGIGDADHFALPGDPLDELLVLDCPEGDYTLTVVLYRADAPPHCPHHPEHALVVRR